jgi:predicted dehydrogenase/nucleoside-diphosphate-sugar epimerase
MAPLVVLPSGLQSMAERRAQDDLRIALVGCGAIAGMHVRALVSVSGARCTALYDVDPARAASLKSLARGAEVVSDLAKLADTADAAVVAVPNAHHAEVTLALLRAGLHVLCEKPLAVTPAEADAMIAAAERSGRTLACGLVRRFYGSTQLVSEALRRELVGRPLRVEVNESVFNWPLRRATFDPAVSGGGVFIDMAPHVLDLLSLWFGTPTLVSYRDDASGGVEATSDATLRCAGVEARIVLTRAFKTPNRTRIVCTGGHIDIDPHDRERIGLVFTDGKSAFPTTAQCVAGDPLVAQLRNFVDAVRGEAALIAPATAAVPVVKLIADAYTQRQPLDPPRSAAPRAGARAASRKILLTGAAGAVGTRMVELWAERGELAELRCLVRRFRSAARIMRFPVEVVEGDLVDREAVRRAAQGCDAIVHLGVGDQARLETKTLLKVARELGIRRFVHMSTAAVYGRGMPSQLEARQEQTPLQKTGEPYADQKAAAERLVLAATDLESVVLRPHIVYGPGMRWSGELLELLPRGEVPRVEPSGWCNLIYVDDLVEAVRRGLETDRGFGEPLFITDGAPLPWSAYIDAHARLLGVSPRAVAASAVSRSDGLRAFVGDSVRAFVPVLKSAELKRFLLTSPAMQRSFMPAYLALRETRFLAPHFRRLREGSVPVAEHGPGFNETWTELQLSQARLSGTRAASAIGYRPQVGFAEGLERTAAWFGRLGLVPR